jgi:hypothetical protein
MAMMKSFLLVLVSAIVVTGSLTVCQAVTLPQSSALATKAKADAAARAKFQATVKARSESLAAKAKADAAAKAKTTVLTKLTVRAETARRREAATKAAKLHHQVVSTAAALGARSSGKPEHVHAHKHGGEHGEHAEQHGHHADGRTAHQHHKAHAQARTSAARASR